MLDLCFLTKDGINPIFIDIPDALYEELIEAKFFSFSKSEMTILAGDTPGEATPLVKLSPELKSKFSGVLFSLIAKKCISICTFSLLFPKKSEHEDTFYSIEVLFDLIKAFRLPDYTYLRA
jgi:hypothetical protein